MKLFVCLGYFIAGLMCLLAIALVVESVLEVYWRGAWIAGTPSVLLIAALTIFLAGASIAVSAETIRRGEVSRRDAEPQRGGRS